MCRLARETACPTVRIQAHAESVGPALACPRGSSAASLDGAGSDFIMHRNRIDSAQECFRFWFENRSTVVRTCKPLHCLQRIKQVDHHEFDFSRSIISKNVAAPVAFDPLETGKHGKLQKILVSVGVLNFGPTPPMTCDQETHPALQSSPVYRLCSNPAPLGSLRTDVDSG